MRTSYASRVIHEDTRQRLADALSAVAPLSLAVVFGSVARGEAREGSDLDVAILPADGELSLSEQGAIVRALERASGREVDLVLLDRVDDGLAWRIARDGVCLVSRPAPAFPAWRARVAIQHADWVEMRGDAVEQYRRAVAHEPGAR
jgi:predicted nucleotidyltransferase